jgi:DNA-binding response OmpR family regulator
MPRTILVIDDDPVILTGNRFILERAGYRVLSASNGEDGERLALESRPDLILLDLLMPRRNGFMVLENLKGKLGDQLKVVMLTANGDQAHRDLASFLGADGYLEKPITAETLLQELQRCMPEIASHSRTDH